MATIHWAHGVSGTFSVASNWQGDVAPGAGDTAVIDAAASSSYQITLNAAATLGGLVLNQADATLALSASLTTPDLALESGQLLLDGGSMSGTVHDTGGTVALADNTISTLNNVTWQGKLNAVFPKVRKHSVTPTLTVVGGLTLTGASGHGAGSAVFNGPVTLDGLTSLNNATISFKGDPKNYYGVNIVNSPTITFGAALNFNGGVSLSAGETLINDGHLTSDSLGGTIVNNGTLSGGSPNYQFGWGASITNNGVLDAFNTTISGPVINNGLITQGGALVGSFTNNGTIQLDAGNQLAVLYQEVTAPGPNGVIDLNSGTLAILGTFTTAQLLGFLADQNVRGTGSYGTDLDGTLNNAGSTLGFGSGTTIGVLGDGGLGVNGIPIAETVEGGSLVDHGGSGTLELFNLQNLSFSSADSTLTLIGTNFDNVALTGATTLDTGDSLLVAQTLTASTLTGVATINDDTLLTLDGITGTGADGTTTVNVGTTGAEPAVLTVTSAQSLAGFNFNVGAGSEIVADTGANLDGANFGIAAASATAQLAIDSNGAGATLGTGFTVTMASATDTLRFEDYAGSAGWFNEATINVPGTISIGQDSATRFTNSGTIAVATGGALLVGATSTLVNNRAVSVANATIDGAVTGNGTISITGTGGDLGLAAAVGAPQVIAFLGANDILGLTTSAAETGFAGTLSGFAKGDQISFADATITAARFAGHAIAATLSTGTTLTLATASALAGSLSILNSGGNATLTYGTAAKAALHDWSAGRATSAQTVGAADTWVHGGRLMFMPSDHVPMHWFTLHALF